MPAPSPPSESQPVWMACQGLALLLLGGRPEAEQTWASHVSIRPPRELVIRNSSKKKVPFNFSVETRIRYTQLDWCDRFVLYHSLVRLPTELMHTLFSLSQGRTAKAELYHSKVTPLDLSLVTVKVVCIARPITRIRDTDFPIGTASLSHSNTLRREKETKRNLLPTPSHHANFG